MVTLETQDYRAEFVESLKMYEEWSGEYDSFRELRLFYEGTAAITKKLNGEKVIFSFTSHSTSKSFGSPTPTLDSLLLNSETSREVNDLNKIFDKAFNKVKESKDAIPRIGFASI